jgi:hypothetical protein
MIASLPLRDGVVSSGMEFAKELHVRLLRKRGDLTWRIAAFEISRVRVPEN